MRRLISRRSILVRTGAFAAAGGGLWLLRDKVIWPAPRPVFAGGADGSGWLHLAPDVGVPLVDALVAGEPVRALVDSGAQASVIDRGLAERLGLTGGLSLPVMAFGVSGAPQAGRTVRADVSLGALSLPGLAAAALDLGPLGALRGSGPPVAAVIGQDVLRTVVLDLDLPAARLAFRPAGAPPPPGASAVSARRKGRELYAAVEVEGVALELAVDTGLSSALALSEELALSTGLLAPGRDVRWTHSVTLGGAGRGREVLAERVEFGGRTLRRAPVAVFDRAASSLLPTGLIGSGALRRSRAVLDVGGGRLWLAPGAPVTVVQGG